MYKNILCWKRNRPRGPYNEIRITELILCSLCIGVPVYLSMSRITMASGILTMILIVSVTFTLITLVDVIVICSWWPIGWRAWILFSVSASLLFFLCAGLTPLIQSNNFWIFLLMYTITAFVFLLDGLCMIRLIYQLDGTSGRPCLSPRLNKSSQILPLNVKVIPETATETFDCKFQQKKCVEKSYKLPPTIAMPYGGTFHVSKNMPPLPSPEISEISNSKHSTLETSHMYNDTFPDAEIKSTRTVSVMARMVPKKIVVDLTPLQSPFTQKSINVFQENEKYTNKKSASASETYSSISNKSKTTQNNSSKRKLSRSYHN